MATGPVTRQIGRGTLIAEVTTAAPDGAKDLVQFVKNIAGTRPRDIMNMRWIIEPWATANGLKRAVMP